MNVRRFDFDSLCSTNDTALALAGEHPGEVLLVTAATQTGGRGRNGRTWHSPVGGAWLSLAWPCPREPEHYQAAPLLAGLAVIETAGALLPHDADLAIKWPNDVLLNGRKLAGVLCQRQLPAAVSTSHATPANALIVGIGVNVNLDPALLGNDLRRPATSLRQALGHEVNLSAFSDALIADLTQRMARMEAHGLTPAEVAAIEARMLWRGQTVNFQHNGASKQGRLEGLDQYGRLILQTATESLTLASGEIEQLHAF